MKLKIEARVLKHLTAISCFMIIAVSCFIFQGCEKAVDAVDKIDYNLNNKEEFNIVGALHNEGLDSVYNAIKIAAIKNVNGTGTNLKSTNTLDYKSIISAATLKFCTTNEKMKHNIYDYETLLNNSLLKSADIGEFNQKQQELLGEMNEALKIKFSKKNLSILKEKLIQINAKATIELPKDECAAIYCATSVAYSTYQYWNNNYRKWYFAFHYPEILQQYNDAQINRLSLKNGKLSLKDGSIFSDYFNSVEDWWNGGTAAVSDWFNTYGYDIMVADGVGGAWGCVAAIQNLGAASLVFGPDGLVVTAVGGAVCGAISGSAQGIIGIFIVT